MAVAYMRSDTLTGIRTPLCRTSLVGNGTRGRLRVQSRRAVGGAPLFWTVVERVSALAALFGVPYLVVQARRRAPRFTFTTAGSSRGRFERDNLTFGQVGMQGTLVNRSLDPNTIHRLHLVIWRTRRRRSTRRHGYGGVSVKVAGQPAELPLAFAPREAKDVYLTFEFPVTGAVDEPLFDAMKPLPGSRSNYLVERYEYELAIEDSLGNLFDADGLPRSLKSMNLRWTLDNAWEQFKDGHPLALLRHYVLIWREDVRFFGRRTLRRFGL